MGECTKSHPCELTVIACLYFPQKTLEWMPWMWFCMSTAAYKAWSGVLHRTCVCVCMCLEACVYMCECLYACVNLCACVCVCVFVFVWMHVCVCVCMCVCLDACLCVRV